MGTVPAPGDLVIAKDSGNDAAYTLSVIPGPPQLRCRTRQDALSVAREWAVRRRVAVWEVDHDGTVLVEPGAARDHEP